MNKNYMSSLLAVFVLALIAWVGSLWLPWLFGIVLPYLAVILFLVGFIQKVLGWSRSAVPFRITTTCGQQKSMPWVNHAAIDNPSSTLGVVIRMALEILTFRSLFRNTRMKLREGDKLAYNLEIFLWVGALAFHYAFLTTVLRHTRFFLDPVPWCIMGIAFTGILMRYFTKVDITAVKELTMGLVTFKWSIPAGISPLFYVHLFFVSVLLAYFPNSKLMHMGGIFLSPTRNMTGNTREVRHVNPWNYPVKVHSYEAYENDFREKMIEAGLPVDKMPEATTEEPSEDEEKE
jgi:nitrate reductase gamma subunit